MLRAEYGRVAGGSDAEKSLVTRSEPLVGATFTSSDADHGVVISL